MLSGQDPLSSGEHSHMGISAPTDSKLIAKLLASDSDSDDSEIESTLIVGVEKTQTVERHSATEAKPMTSSKKRTLFVDSESDSDNDTDSFDSAQPSKKIGEPKLEDESPNIEALLLQEGFDDLEAIIDMPSQPQKKPTKRVSRPRRQATAAFTAQISDSTVFETEVLDYLTSHDLLED